MGEEIKNEDIMSIDNQGCSSILPLSPIVEINESNISENSMMEEKDGVEECKPDNSYSAPVSLGPLMSVSGNGSFSEDEVSSSNSTQSPVTPPEVLRQRISRFQSEYEYLHTEYEELREFTLLEKQINHKDCISKDKVKIQENELFTVNEKIIILMQENSAFKEVLNQNKIERKNLEAKMITLQEYQKAVKMVAHKIKENLQDEVEEIVEKYPNLKYFFRDMEDSELDDDIKLKDIQMLLDICFFKKSELNEKVKLHNSRNKEFCNCNNQLSNTTSKLENLDEGNHDYKTKLAVAEGKIDQLLYALSDSENKKEDVKILLNRAEIEQKRLQNEIQKLKKVGTIEDFQEDFVVIFNVLQHHIDSWDSSKKLLDVFTKLLEDKNLIPSINIIFNSNTQKVLCKVLDKLKKILNTSNHSTDESKSIMETFNNHFENLEKEIHLIQAKVEEITHYVQENILSRINGLENKTYDFNKGFLLKDKSWQKCMCNCMEELKTLKEQIATEINSLNGSEDKNSLISYSSNEIFNKFMQNIIKKQKEIQLNLQEQSNIDFQKVHTKLSDLNNKTMLQESWIKELEKLNEDLSNDLTEMKNKEDDLLCRLKTLSSELKCKKSEIFYFENKILDLTFANEKLNADIMDLTESANTKNKHFQNKVDELYEEVNIKNNLIAELGTNLSSLTSEVETLNVNKDKSIRDKSIRERSTQTNCDLKCVDAESPDHLQEKKCSQTSLMDKFQQEMLLLKNVFHCNTDDIELSEQLKSYSDKFDVLKDIVELFKNKLIEMETIQDNSLYQFQSFIESKTKRFGDFEKNINKIYETFPFDSEKSGVNDSFEEENSSDCDNLKTFKLELELTKEDCLSLANGTEKFQHHANSFHSVLQTLTNKFQTIENEIIKTIQLIKELRKSVELERFKNKKLKTHIKLKSKQIHLLEANISNLENKFEGLQLSETILMNLSGLDIEMPDNDGITGKIKYVNTVLKENLENKTLLSSLATEVDFFSNQCDMMRCYIEALERKLMLAVEDKEVVISQFGSLTVQLKTANEQLSDAKVFVNKLISKLPTKVSTLNQAFEVVDNIFSDYANLKNVEVNFNKEIEIRDEKLSKLLEEQKSLKLINSSLRIELTKCEDSIRNLRSELRSIRLENQKRRSDSRVPEK